MNRKKLAASVAAVILALGAGGAGVAYATGGDSGERVTGPDAAKAKSAALEAAGGGTVTEIEQDDGNGTGAFEVEVRRDDGSQVEVHLDRDLNVVGQEADDDGPNDEDGSNDN
jgi:Peptidase propeptide and YPEB domain